MYSQESDNSILVQREILRVKIVTSATLKKKNLFSPWKTTKGCPWWRPSGWQWVYVYIYQTETWTDGSLLGQQDFFHIISLACGQGLHEFFMNQQDILIFWLLPPLPSHWISFAHRFWLVSFIDTLENAKGFCRDLYPFSLSLSFSSPRVEHIPTYPCG